MNTIRWSLVTISLATIFLISGCGTMKAYPGPELSKDKVALIKNRGNFMSSVSVSKVDGENTWFHSSVAVEPGTHTLLVQVSKNNFLWSVTAHGVVRFTAEAGREYQVDAATKVFSVPSRAWFWIEDVESRMVVGGEKPKE